MRLDTLEMTSLTRGTTNWIRAGVHLTRLWLSLSPLHFRRANAIAHKLRALTLEGGFLREVGWVRSLEEETCLSKDGEHLPWLPYCTLSLLSNRLSKVLTVFEYGSGASTLWFARRVEKVISVEHEGHWYERLKALLPENVNYQLRALNTGYVDSITDHAGRIDLALIDGRRRVESAMAAMDALSPGGVIVWDNTDRQRYVQGITHLHANGFKSITLTGLAPGASRQTQTTVFYREENVLGI